MTINTLKQTEAAITTMGRAHIISSVRKTALQEGINQFELGGYFKRIKDDRLWIDTHISFTRFVEDIGVPIYKANALIKIYTHLTDSSVPWEAINDLPWSKIKAISPYLTAENVNEWHVMATEMNTEDLLLYIKRLRKGKNVDKEIKYRHTVLLFSDQDEALGIALDIIKKERGINSKSLAFHHIVMQYLNSHIGESE